MTNTVNGLGECVDKAFDNLETETLVYGSTMLIKGENLYKVLGVKDVYHLV